VKDLLCKAFCDQLSVRDVPAGLAVSTALNLSNGEPLGFYLVGPDAAGRYRIEDDGTTIPLIEAAGVDLDTQTRADAISALYEEYGASYNSDSGELSTPPLQMDEIPQRAMRFIALLLRLQDLILLTPERVLGTFRDDAKKAIRDAIGDRASVRENESPSKEIDFPADLLIEAPRRAPVAVFLAMSEQRVLEAVVVHMALAYEAKLDYSIVALLENDTSVTRRMRQRAANRLAAMPIFEGDERAAVQRIEQEVFGRNAVRH
jgi:hypothetical protein